MCAAYVFLYSCIFVCICVCLSKKGNITETSHGCKCLAFKWTELENKSHFTFRIDRAYTKLLIFSEVKSSLIYINQDIGKSNWRPNKNGKSGTGKKKTLQKYTVDKGKSLKSFKKSYSTGLLSCSVICNATCLTEIPHLWAIMLLKSATNTVSLFWKHGKSFARCNAAEHDDLALHKDLQSFKSLIRDDCEKIGSWWTPAYILSTLTRPLQSGSLTMST